MTDADYAARDAERRFQRQLRNNLAILALLFVINAVTSWGHWWIQWPALGLGMGLIVQYVRTLNARGDAARDPALPDAPALGPSADPLVARAEALAARERDAR